MKEFITKKFGCLSNEVIWKLTQSSLIILGIIVAGILAFQQNRINQALLDLSTAPSVEITYDENSQFVRVFNRGTENVGIANIIFDEIPSDINSETDQTRMVSPGGNYYYVVNDKIEEIAQQVVDEVGLNGEKFIPFRLYVETVNQQKYVVENLLYIKVSNGNKQIHTQTTKVIKSNW